MDLFIIENEIIKCIGKNGLKPYSDETLTKIKNILERERIKGVLLGLSLAKKAFGDGFGLNDILENEKIYQEELSTLLTD